jgi:hypothetical protein
MKTCHSCQYSASSTKTVNGELVPILICAEDEDNLHEVSPQNICVLYVRCSGCDEHE